MEPKQTIAQLDSAILSARYVYVCIQFYAHGWRLLSSSKKITAQQQLT